MNQVKRDPLKVGFTKKNEKADVKTLAFLEGIIINFIIFDIVLPSLGMFSNIGQYKKDTVFTYYVF